MPAVQLIERRNSRGQGDGRLKSRQILCSTKPVKSDPAIKRRRAPKRICPNIRATGLRGLFVAADCNAVKLHAVIDQAIAQLLCDYLLQRFQLRIDKLDHLAGFDIDQMVVMCLW